jgi:ABC-type phosphate transport system substrate-binding protein
MNRDLKRIPSWIPALLALCAAAAAAAPAAAHAEPLAIVVDRNNPKNDISLDELKSLYLGKRHEWPDGSRVVPIDLEAGSPGRAEFQVAFLSMNGSSYDRYWVEQKVRGAGTPPRAAPSPSLALKLVAKVRGAVGYVPVSHVDASVKVLTVEGKSPGQPGYPAAK